MNDRRKSHLPDLAPTQFVGGTYGGWVRLLPPSCIPYLQLTRLNIAAPLALVYFPHLFGVLHAAVTNGPRNYSPEDILHSCALLLGGSFFYSNAAHVWDDFIDAPIDKQITRTQNRPIPRGVVSSRAAIVFTVVSGIGAASFLLFLPTITAFATIPSIITATYYPWAKKHDLFPQVILGICLAWGIMVGNASLSTRNWPWENSSALCLVAAYTFVIVIYDTIYAHQDIPDDLRLGLGSTAVLFRNCTKLALSALTACMAASLYYCGILAEMGFLFFVIGVGGSVVSVGLMLYEVRLDDPASCWKWFSMGFWTTMLSITGGLVSEYMMR